MHKPIGKNCCNAFFNLARAFCNPSKHNLYRVPYFVWSLTVLFHMDHRRKEEEKNTKVYMKKHEHACTCNQYYMRSFPQSFRPPLETVQKSNDDYY